MYSGVYTCLVISMINSSIGKSVISFRLKANRLRLISVVGVPFTRVIFIGYNSCSLARAKKTSSSLKEMIDSAEIVTEDLRLLRYLLYQLLDVLTNASFN